MRSRRTRGRSERWFGFTLVELLVTISIVSVLSSVVAFLIRPAEFLRRSRDSRRFTDMDLLQKAVGALQADKPDVSLGVADTVYVSLPSPNSDCSGLGLPPLPASWAYVCRDASAYRRVDGSGWVPLNFAQFSGGSFFSALPVDPVNTVENGSYYTYVTGGSFKFTAFVEAEGNATKMRNDGGSDAALYEVGDDFTLANFQRGLVGYWKFDGDYAESSGRGLSGTPFNGVGFSAGALDQAGSFDGTDDYISIPNSPDDSLNVPAAQGFTVLLWGRKVGVSNSTSSEFIIDKSRKFGPQPVYTGQDGYSIKILSFGGKNIEFAVLDLGVGSSRKWYSSNWLDGEWHFMGLTLKRAPNIVAVYWDGEKAKPYLNWDTNLNLIGDLDNTMPLFLSEDNTPYAGLIDEMRIYNRALSEQEIKILYKALK